jgi:hypothetical protein
VNPATFPEANIVLGAGQPEYRPLPAFHHEGVMTVCWRLSLRERLRLLWTGLLWQQVLTFGKPFQPQFLTVTKGEVIVEKGGAE